MGSSTQSELTAITRCYDLILWLVPALDKFPRARKFSLGDRMEKLALDILELLIEAKYARVKSSMLAEANLKLEKLRFLVRLSKDLRCLGVKSYGHAAELIDDLGREVGGWLKQQRRDRT